VINHKKNNMKTRILTLLLVVVFYSSHGQLIQGTIKSGVGTNEIEVWIRPDFNNTTQYIAQMGFPIAFPVSAPRLPTGMSVTLDPQFITDFGNNYAVTVNPIAHNTANTENYFNIVLIRSGGGASNPQTWVAGTEYRVLTATFIPASGPGSKVKLADYQDGGSDGQGYYYVADGNANYYISANSATNFYGSTESGAGGSAAAGFAETNALITLPVNLLKFSGYKNGSKNTLQWTTASEQNNYGFEIQRSLDGVTFSHVGFVSALSSNGNSSVNLNYVYDDNKPTGNKQYYRLKQIDIDRRGKLSNVVVVTGNKPGALSLGAIYPNPSRNQVNVIIQSPRDGLVQISVVDLAGRLLNQQVENVGAGSNSVILDISQFSKGGYFLQVNERGESTKVTTLITKQ
jgi:hypothetical protein